MKETRDRERERKKTKIESVTTDNIVKSIKKVPGLSLSRSRVFKAAQLQ